jgi:Fur family transcriptional regulator, ferric uptake regulator
MTVPCLSAPVPVETTEGAMQALRAQGRRLSAARRLVLDAVFGAGRPVRAEEIAAGVGGRLPRSDLSSVYRNLEVLEDLGLVRHMHLGHGPGLYAPASSDHEYLLCERCFAFRTVPAGTLAPVHDAAFAATGWRARFRHFPLTGLCPSCCD